MTADGKGGLRYDADRFVAASVYSRRLSRVPQFFTELSLVLQRMESILQAARYRAAPFFSSFPLSPDALAGGETPGWRMIIMDSMNYLMGKRHTERQLWNESLTREVQMVDEILRPWVRRRISEGVPAGEMLEHESAAALLAGVAQWRREY